MWQNGPAKTLTGKLALVPRKTTTRLFHCLSLAFWHRINPLKNNSNAITQLLLSYMQKQISKDQLQTVLSLRFHTFLDYQQFRTTSAQIGEVPSSSHPLAVRNAFCAIKAYRTAQCTALKSPDVLAALNKSRCTPVSGIILAGSRRSTSVFHVKGTISSCRRHSRFWVIRDRLRLYLTSSLRRSSLGAHKAIVTCYAASREKLFVRQLFWRLYGRRRRIEKGF